MRIDNEFSLGQTVYLKTDSDQSPRLVTGIRVRPGGLLLYDISCGVQETGHYEMEISAERNILLTSTN